MLLTLLLSFAMATAIGVGATPSFDFPNVLRRDEIPAGVTVYEYNATAAALGAAAAPNRKSHGLLEERDDCDGSVRCRRRVTAGNCKNAVKKYRADAFYCGYTSRVWNHCTAIYHCDDDYHCLKGDYLQEMFRSIYEVQGCGRCGSFDFPVGCHATFNYCYACSDVG